ncbi:MAG: tRNA (adenosine(37)-N6)-threonylcarbamoyltransferase complex ATPase subunit type 1 TsaE [Chloroflexota bacterium]|nr:tRNA (adenosine(37)-N6)-threonylcarbamoyltransferase complex ATPase subunit type 1 TsaE [Chloroflexota bacterium]MEE2687391.1 tRNA (adenosine(37)-N6)-threonylcarbamoyltransferase complex ATPase subunit type 1 TsaE [Chloroflexota bacterium]
MTPTINIISASAESTTRIGFAIGQSAQSGDVFLLTGELGAGKTCLTQGIAEGVGISGHTRSPTFVLMTQYKGNITIYHADLYRIDDPSEAWDIGLIEQLTGDGICIVEWADKAEEIFPEECLWINLSYYKDINGVDESNSLTGAIDPKSTENLRKIVIYQSSSRYSNLVNRLSNITDTEVKII